MPSYRSLAPVALALAVAACADTAAPTRDPYACPLSDGEWGLLGCARVEVLLTRPDGTPAVGVHLSSRVIPPPAIFPILSALPSDSSGRTRIQLNWEVPPLPETSTLQVIAIRLEPARSLVHFLDTTMISARNSLAGQRPRTDTVAWQLERW